MKLFAPEVYHRSEELLSEALQCFSEAERLLLIGRHVAEDWDKAISAYGSTQSQWNALLGTRTGIAEDAPRATRAEEWIGQYARLLHDKAVHWPGSVEQNAIDGCSAEHASPELKSADLSWVLMACNSENEIDQRALVSIIKGVRELVAHQDFGFLAMALNTIVKSETASAKAIVACIRAAYGARQKIAGWKQLIRQARDALVQRGIPEKAALKGI